MGIGPGSPFGQSPLNLLDVEFVEVLQTLHIPTNKKLEDWTQYRLLLPFRGGKRRFVKKPAIGKNPEKSQG